MTEAVTDEPTCTLACVDGDVVLPLSRACMSRTIKAMIEDVEEDLQGGTVPVSLPNTAKDVAEQVAACCAHLELEGYGGAAATAEDRFTFRKTPLHGWRKDFVNVSMEMLIAMILAANFLDLPPMLDTCCKAVAEIVQGKTAAEVKAVFGIEGEYTDEEKEALLSEHPWLERVDIA